MRDVFEARKVNKDKNWMNGVLVELLLYFLPLV